jgi:hypothetical protein
MKNIQFKKTKLNLQINIECVLIIIRSSNKENVPFTWPGRVQNVSSFTITGDKFVNYVPISRYGDFYILQ